MQGACDSGALSFTETLSGSMLYFQVPNTTLCIDIYGGQTTNGTPVQLWTCGTGGYANQLFTPTTYADGSRSFTANISGRCMDVTSESTLAGAMIQQWDCNGSAAQKFAKATPSTVTPPPPPPPPPPSGTYHPATWYPTLKSGPARIGEIYLSEGETLTGGSVNCTGHTWCVHMANNSTIDGVEIYGTNVTDYGAAIDMNYASNAKVINSYIHDVGADGLMCNTDSSTGMSNNLVQDNRFENTGRDAMHFKGTNALWNNGAWIPDYKRNKNHKIIGNVSIRAWRNGGDSFSYELQDGQLDMVIQNNYADETYSLVGLVGSSQLGGSGRVQITGNYVNTSNSGSGWGFEIGNVRGATVQGNTFDGTPWSVVNTGNVDQENVNNSYGPDSFINGASTKISRAWDGGGNVVIAPDTWGPAY
jgi:hypothetical protein